jgi:osmotically-inducible protein OsmY
MSQDHHLQQAVLAELEREPGVTAAHIGVTANAGVVTLTGHVANIAEKHEASGAAERVKAVKAVANELQVRLPEGARRSDEEIAAAAVARLAWNTVVPRDAIKIEVENGQVSLTGQVDWFFQKAAAERDIRQLWGVVEIANRVTVKPRVDVVNISDDIMHALNRSWFFDPKTISVTANGGKVRLGGTARSLHERKLAAETAWGEPGVTDVENDIVVV